jgi:hypothetical protein
MSPFSIPSIRFLSLTAIAAFLHGVETPVRAQSPSKTQSIPTHAIGKKKELLFADDFEGEPSKVWHKVVPTFAIENGALKGTQTREKDAPSTDGKSVIKAHAAVHGLEIPTKDSIIETRIKFEGATMIDVEFDDRKYAGSQYGHICRAIVRPNGVTILDEKEGTQRWDIRNMADDPTRKEERAKLLQGRSATFPVKLEHGKWYLLQVETVGDTMRVCIDGAPVAFHRSSGIAHETKSKIELGVAGKDGFFDDIKVWNAEPAESPAR